MKSRILFFIIGIIIALIVLTAVRFFTYKQILPTHYHANFLMYLNGKKIDFSSSKYMEPVASCSIDENQKQSAIERVHMHSNKGDLIHVHDDGVTWRDFASNIGFDLGKDYIVDDTGKIYQNTDSMKVKYILNGELAEKAANFEIKSEDKLLINYGSEDDQTLKDRYKEVPSTSHETNLQNDPASCSGTITEDFWTKLKKSFIN